MPRRKPLSTRCGIAAFTHGHSSTGRLFCGARPRRSGFNSSLFLPTCGRARGSGAPRDAGCCGHPYVLVGHAKTLARRLDVPCDRDVSPLGAPPQLWPRWQLALNTPIFQWLEASGPGECPKNVPIRKTPPTPVACTSDGWLHAEHAQEAAPAPARLGGKSGAVVSIA